MSQTYFRRYQPDGESNMSDPGLDLVASMSNPMPATERMRLLAQPHVAIVSIPRGAERAPLCAPIWYGYEPSGEIWWITPKPSRKGKLLREGLNINLTVTTGERSSRYVSVEGSIVALETPSMADHQYPLAVRYLGQADGRAYADAIANFNDGCYLVRVSPRNWLSGDLAPQEHPS